jgi:hypothetical protein
MEAQKPKKPVTQRKPGAKPGAKPAPAAPAAPAPAPPRPPQQAKAPFYTQVTNVKVGDTTLPLVTLPAGTVLFRGIQLPEQAKSREIFRDYLGDPQNADDVCLSPTHNVFFYPFPTVAFGVDRVGARYKAIQAVVLVHPVTVVTTVAPSELVRGSTKSFSGTAPFQRCATRRVPLATPCHPLTKKELEALEYDNCLHPMYQATSGTRGMMAIAKLDDLNPEAGKETAMVKYIRDLEARRPRAGAEALLWAYTDNAAAYKTKIPHVGFPELALYPYREHAGLAPLTRKVPTDAAAQRLLEEEARKDNLNYLPLATITKDATIDMVEGLFNYERLGLAANAFTTPALQQQPAIEQRTLEFVDRAQTAGITLPYYGGGKMTFDLRTGFFVMRQMVPTDYTRFLVPLDTEAARKTVRDYMIMFRTYNPAKFARVEEGYPFPRQFVFSRPPLLKPLFDTAKIPMPANIAETSARITEVLEKNAANAAANAAYWRNREPAEGGRRLTRRAVRGSPHGTPFARAAAVAKSIWKAHSKASS